MILNNSENSQLFDGFTDPIDGSITTVGNSVNEPTEYMKEFVVNFEKREKKRKKETPPRGVEVFYKEK